MASILEEFAYGNLSPAAQKNDAEYLQAVSLVSRNEEKLMTRLDGRDTEIFEAYADMQGEVRQLTAVKNLIYGFRLGLLMTAESFLNMDDLYDNGNQA